MKNVAIAILLILSLSGCARVMYAIEMTPQRTAEAFSDPVRRTHLMTQIGRVATTAGVGITCVSLLAPTIVGILVCPIVAVIYDYLNYEYILEPLSKELVSKGKPSLVGPYFETGPRTDEGEVFVNP